MKIEMICEACGTKFHRERGEINRNKRLGRKAYCSLKCAGNIENIPLDKRGKTEHLRADNRRDEFSPFRHHMKCMHNHAGTNGSRRKPVEITLQDLKEQWERQNGVCPYTGWQMRNAETTSRSATLPHTPDRASVDRIDSTKPYTRGNIQFVSLIAQYAKNRWSDVELLNFCRAVAGQFPNQQNAV